MGFHPKDLVLVGVGQLGTLFGEGALSIGRRVTPLRRDSDVERSLDDVAPDAPVLVTTGEKDLPGALAQLPKERWPNVILVQNELFPSVWQGLGLEEPTVAVVWLSKKKDRPVEIGGPTEVYGKHADVVAKIHEALSLPCTQLPSSDALSLALVAKYTFILTINALGLEEDLTLGAWLEKDRARVLAVTDDARRLADRKLGRATDGKKVQKKVQDAMEALATYPAKGRTAQERLERAREDAEAFGLSLPALVGK